ncbi:MAG: aromatic amino acid lyase, partial [Deltaproteobacteria bacterium]|nr:aromatic amino acid lyase [Deltaproteobacteria bacterium]
VTTGVGDSVTTAVGGAHVDDLPLNLLRFHGCGTGPALEPVAAAAVVATRLASLSRGHSGVRRAVLERLCHLLNHRILPVIPAIGSVGASGDLTPLSYVAALLVGEREAWVAGAEVPAEQALRDAGLQPLQLLAKESLSLMNGTSAMTALACLAFVRAQRLTRWMAAQTAVQSDVLQGNPAHFDNRLFDQKPHPGQALVARWVAADLEYPRARPASPARLQDRYSIRCAPHIIGVLVDALAWMRPWLEVELNSVNDNPILDPDSGEVLHGGNFYGGHVGFAMDSLKAAVASMVDLLDRQLVQLCDPKMNHGLPANLVGAVGPEQAAHHGFKAMAIATSALAAEAGKMAMPVAVFSRSTECHNQDKVPMATIAARDALAVLDLAETAAAMVTLAAAQAVDLRRQHGCHKRSRALHASLRTAVPMVTADRRMDRDIAQVLAMLQAGQLDVGSNADGAEAP